jgi:hypothetical protein
VKRLITACAGLFVCASLPAQGSMTTPPGGLTGEGAHYAYLMGIWSDMHIQQNDDMHSNGKAKAISEIAFRLDNRLHSSSTATGRSWTNISVDVSEPTTYNSMSTSFASNHGSSRTRVFDSKWTWPSQTGYPLLKPDVWGGVKGQLRFPFTKPWVYTAKGSILADYTFRGGTLVNNGTWTSIQAAYFYLDGEVINTTATTGTVQRVPTTPPLCADSAITVSTGAFTYGYAQAYGKSNTTITLRGKLVFQHYSYYTAPDAPVVQAVNLGGGIPNGVNIGAGCNNLYVDFSKPVVLMTFKTIAPYGYSGIMGWAVNWRNEFASLDLWLQAAWLDSNTKRFKLTSATNVTLPNRLPPDALPRYKTMYQRDTVSSTGFGPYTSGTYFPYTRYKTN